MTVNSPDSSPEAEAEAESEAEPEPATEGDPTEITPPPELVAESELETLKAENQRLQAALMVRTSFDAEIDESTAEIDAAAVKVMRANSAVEEAKGDLKSAKELYDRKVNELRELLKDHGSGQQRLPFGAALDPVAVTVTTVGGVTVMTPSDEAIADSLRAAGVNAESSPIPDYDDSPIEMLLTKEIKTEFGADVIAAAKDREEPIGMSEKQLEKLHECDIRMIGKLEKCMRENRYWAEELGLGEKTAARLVETLRVWRGKFPQS